MKIIALVCVLLGMTSTVFAAVPSWQERQIVIQRIVDGEIQRRHEVEIEEKKIEVQMRLEAASATIVSASANASSMNISRQVNTNSNSN